MIVFSFWHEIGNRRYKVFKTYNPTQVLVQLLNYVHSWFLQFSMWKLDGNILHLWGPIRYDKEAFWIRFWKQNLKTNMTVSWCDVAEKLSKRYVDQAQNAPGFYSMEAVIEMLSNGSVNFPSPTLPLLQHLGKWGEYLRGRNSSQGLKASCFITPYFNMQYDSHNSEVPLLREGPGTRLESPWSREGISVWPDGIGGLMYPT